MPIALLPEVSTNWLLAVGIAVAVGVCFLFAVGANGVGVFAMVAFGALAFPVAFSALNEAANEKEGQERVAAFSEFYGADVSAKAIARALSDGVAGDATTVKMNDRLVVLTLVKDEGKLKLVNGAGEVLTPEELDTSSPQK